MDGGEYDGGEPLTEFLEDYVDLGMYVYINTIGNYFTDSADESTYSVPSKNVVVLPSLQGTVAIDGTLKVGETLTARISDIPEEAGIVYQWQECDTKDGIFTDISGATESSYTLTSEQKGNYIRVIVTPKEGTGYAGSLFAVSETYVKMCIRDSPNRFFQRTGGQCLWVLFGKGIWSVIMEFGDETVSYTHLGPCPGISHLQYHFG